MCAAAAVACVLNDCLSPRTQVPGGPSGTLAPIREQKAASFGTPPDPDKTFYLMAGFIQYDLG